ncbi:helicase associated domain-containing protein [Marinoscillum sp. 108]|uniref:helicase associated domain-containing protein n=1 Tax=Marinoscillum sp. 108 TaxID=2653151 RepID=UPI0012F25440|nr:helicase associated domain-containing protein [Marinoscillum sp. 108]VXD14789.1 hypothetical protein MARINOS108_12119 [Marinoscillum sp. 108]
MKKSFLITIIITLLGLGHTQGQSVYWEQSADNTSSGNLSIGSIAANSYSKLVIKGPNQPLNSGGKRDLSFEFAAAGKAQIRSYRGGSWDTYMQFLTTPVSGGDPVPQMHISHDGKIGIGTTTPVHLLHLKSAMPYMRFELNSGSYSMIEWLEASTRVAGIHWVGHQTPNRLSFMTGVTSISEQMSITETGNVGIGTTNPLDRLTVTGGNVTIGNTTNQEYSLTFRPSDNTARNALVGYSSNTAAADYIGLKSNWGSIRFSTNGGNEVVRITANERVGIGTSDPQSKLAVDGTIRAKEIKVMEVIGAPDYVFEADYNLRTLEATKAYIKENKHLPEIPSAAEIEANGIDLGDMNMRLLKKIEELTLYQIELLERIEKLETNQNK